MSDETDSEQRSREITAEELGFAVDDQGIPILDEILEFDSDDPDAEPTPDAGEGGTNLRGRYLPDYDILRTAIRERLRTQLQVDLRPIIERIAASAAENASRELEKIIRKRLARALTKRLTRVVEDKLEEHFEELEEE